MKLAGEKLYHTHQASCWRRCKC